MNKLLTRIAPMALIGTMLLPTASLAQSPFQDAQSTLGQIGQEAQISTDRTLPEIIGQVINIILGFLGIVLLLLILYAGFLWMTAGGDESKVKTARQIIANSIIGLIIIVAAFAISNFVLQSLVDVTQ